MKAYTCVDCGTVGEAPARGARKRCGGCQVIDQRERLRRSRARRRVPPTFTCVDCGVTSEGRSNRKRCDDCQAEATRTYAREYYRENLAAPPRTFTCVDCGATGVQAAKGKARLRCDACKRKAKAERMRVDALPPTPCVDCGVTVPRSDRARRRPFKRCPDCRNRRKRANNRASERRNPESTRDSKRKYRESNRDKIAEYNSAYRAEHQAERSAYNAAWNDANPERVRAWNDRRRALVNGADYEEFDPREVFDRDGWVCQLCREPVNPALTWPDLWSASLDHVLPLSRGGAHTIQNSQLAHLDCNRRKHAKITEVA